MNALSRLFLNDDDPAKAYQDKGYARPTPAAIDFRGRGNDQSRTAKVKPVEIGAGIVDVSMSGGAQMFGHVTWKLRPLL
jgi:hypothetical protein